LDISLNQYHSILSSHFLSSHLMACHVATEWIEYQRTVIDTLERILT
jgi:hypothetical protein